MSSVIQDLARLVSEARKRDDQVEQTILLKIFQDALRKEVFTSYDAKRFTKVQRGHYREYSLLFDGQFLGTMKFEPKDGQVDIYFIPAENIK